VDWIDLAQDGDRWRAIVSGVMYLRVPQMQGNFLLAEKRLACQGLCSVE
jgi:hypothetical protein